MVLGLSGGVYGRPADLQRVGGGRAASRENLVMEGHGWCKSGDHQVHLEGSVCGSWRGVEILNNYKCNRKTLGIMFGGSCGLI